MTTITASSTVGIYLSAPAFTNPVVIIPGIAITGNYRGNAIYANVGSWTISNAGTISGAGSHVGAIYLGSGGVVTNQATGLIGLPSSNYSDIYITDGTGNVTNAGIIHGGVWLQSGGTVNNQAGGRIDSSDPDGGYGVGFHAGGTVTNAGEISGLYVAIDAGEGGGTVTNQAGGTLHGPIFGVEMGFPGQVGGGGGNLVNQTGATITGDSGFVAGGTAATVSNAGVIIGTFAGTTSGHGHTFVVGAGVSLSAGGIVINQYGGAITGASYGIYVSNAIGTIVNDGSIAGNPIATASFSAGIDLFAGGSIYNQSGGRIAGFNGIYARYGSGTTNMTVVNSGNIGGDATFGDGIYLGIGGRVTNQSGGSISGYHGISGQVLTVVNDGSISGNLTANTGTFNVGAGVDLHAGGAVTNQSGGSISGRFGVISDPTTDGPASRDATIVNAADISGNATASTDVGAGVIVGSGGSVTNLGSADISGFIGIYGLKQDPAKPVTIVNAGIISGSTVSATATGGIFITPFTVTAAGIYIPAGGNITNQVGGTISGYRGVVAGTIHPATIENAGTIDGIATAVDFGVGVNDRLVADPGAIFSGTVNGGNTIGAAAISTLELATGASTGTLTGLGAQFLNFGAIDFDPGADWFIAGNTAGLAGTISGFTLGDTIEVSGAIATGLTYAAGVLQIGEASGTIDLNLPGTFTTTDFAFSNVAAGADITIACFRSGTRISTARGEVAVEQLRIGEMLPAHTGDRRLTPHRIEWIGHRTIDCRRHPKPALVWPVRIAAGAFGPSRPHRDLFLSPDHAMFVMPEGHARGVLIPIRHLLNGTNITQQTVDTVTYWHIELSLHAVLLANGLMCETYLDTGHRHAFANGGAATQLHPDFATQMWEAQGCARLVCAGDELELVRRRLHRRNPLRAAS
jgi:hypothetical protein